MSVRCQFFPKTDINRRRDFPLAPKADFACKRKLISAREKGSAIDLIASPRDALADRWN
jgi:hypothetical protein